MQKTNSLKSGKLVSSCRSTRHGLGLYSQHFTRSFPEGLTSSLSLPLQVRTGAAPPRTSRWPRQRPLSSAPSRRRTPPNAPSPSGWATARSPGDSTPGSPAGPLRCSLSGAPAEKTFILTFCPKLGGKLKFQARAPRWLHPPLEFRLYSQVHHHQGVQGCSFGCPVLDFIY